MQASRLERELAEKQDAERRLKADRAARETAALAKTLAEIDARQNRLTLHRTDSGLVIRGWRGVHDVHTILGNGIAAAVVFGGVLSGALAGGVLGFALAASGIGLGALAASLVAFTRVSWALRIEGRAAELTVDPLWIEGRLRTRRVLGPAEKVAVYVFDAQTDPTFQLAVGGSATTSMSASGADLAVLDELSRFVATKR